jgi:hypothetical protein
MRHHMSYCMSPSFPAGSPWPFGTQKPSSSFVASYQPPSAAPIKFLNYKDSVTRVAGILRIPNMQSRDIG